MKAIDQTILRRRATTTERNGEKSHEERPMKKRERKRGEKKVEAYRIILVRPIAFEKKARSRFSVCLSARVKRKQKIDFVFTSKRAGRSRYFTAAAAFFSNSKARTLTEQQGCLFADLPGEEKVIRLISRYRAFI